MTVRNTTSSWWIENSTSLNLLNLVAHFVQMHDDFHLIHFRRIIHPVYTAKPVMKMNWMTRLNATAGFLPSKVFKEVKWNLMLATMKLWSRVFTIMFQLDFNINVQEVKSQPLHLCCMSSSSPIALFTLNLLWLAGNTVKATRSKKYLKNK